MLNAIEYYDLYTPFSFCPQDKMTRMLQKPAYCIFDTAFPMQSATFCLHSIPLYT